MTFDNPHRRYLALGTAVLVGATGVVSTAGAGSSASQSPPPAKTTVTPVKAHAAAHTRIDRLTASARARYDQEVYGRPVHTQLQRIAHDRKLVSLLESGNTPALKAYVKSRFYSVWYHAHVSRMAILQNGKTVDEIGVPFVVAPSQTAIKGRGGKTIGTLQVSVQDVIGFVRYMHRNFPVDIVARGAGAGHVRTSLPAAAKLNLPARGTVTISGRRYAVRSFHKLAMGKEPVTIWVLARS